ncbi:hypothetical protein Tco_0372199, partial [Tanacetum coccineum]
MRRDSSDKHFFKLETWKVLWTLLSSLGSSEFVCHWANPFKDFEWSNVPKVKLSSLSKTNDTFSSLQALSDLNYFLGGFIDYLWS